MCLWERFCGGHKAIKKRLIAAILGLVVLVVGAFGFRTWKNAPLVTIPLSGIAERVEFSPDGRMIAACTKNGVALYSTSDWKQKRFLPGHTDFVRWMPDNTTILTWGTYYIHYGSPQFQVLTELARWNLLTGTLFYKRSLSSGDIVAVSHDAKLLAFSSSHTVAFLSSADGHPTHVLSPLYVFELQFSPDGRYFASVPVGLEKSSPVHIWDTRTWQEVSMPQHILACCLRYSPDGKMLATGTKTSVTLWDTATWRIIRTMPAHFIYLFRLRFSSDGTRLVGGGRFERENVKGEGPDFFWTLWDPNTGKHIADIHDSYFWEFAPNSSFAYTGDNNIAYWNEKDGKQLWSSAGRVKDSESLETVTYGSLSPNHKLLVTATTFNTGSELFRDDNSPVAARRPYSVIQVWNAPAL